MGETRRLLGFQTLSRCLGDLHISYVKFSLFAIRPALFAYFGEIKNSEISLIWDSLRSTRPLFPTV